MQESTVKFVLILVALVSLTIGGVFLIIPEWFITLSESEGTNVFWLRILGVSFVSLQGVGLGIVAFRRRDTNPLLSVVAFATTAETGVLWFALVTGEHGAGALWTVVVPSLIATAVVILLWGAWLSRRKSIRVPVESGVAEEHIPEEQIPEDSAVPKE